MAGGEEWYSQWLVNELHHVCVALGSDLEIRRIVIGMVFSIAKVPDVWIHKICFLLLYMYSAPH